ncbi:hypothetical protein UA32_11800 [Photobacterium angustum]|nr:hypothetical protein UA32_11800 [Photobacterium angustum]
MLNIPVDELTDNQLIQVCETLNTEYRAGTPLVSDETFDHVYLKALSERLPNHNFLAKPQPTTDVLAFGKVRHPKPMLSTQKAYTHEEVQKWLNKVLKVAKEIGLSVVTLRILPKLDGIAGRLSDGILSTRGDGKVGTDISKLIDHGLVIKGSAESVGEIVIPKAYFNDVLSSEFSHPRNVVSGIASSENLSDSAKQIFNDQAIHYVSFADLQCVTVNSDNLLENLDILIEETALNSHYPLDGTIIEVENQTLKKLLGSSSHHHHWQIAFKTQGETALAKVNSISWQIGKSGRCTPVVNIEPTYLTGALISRITAHHAANVINKGIGVGSVLEIVRSGEVIPFISQIKQRVTPCVPTHCPACDTVLRWKNSPITDEPTFLVCDNNHCPSRVETSIIHFFKTLNVDLFGIKTVEKLVASGFDTIDNIFNLSISDFVSAGLGNGQAANLFAELDICKQKIHEDYKILAALGISKLGRRASENILENYYLSDICHLTSNQLEQIDGFAAKTANSITTAIANQELLITFLVNNLNYTNTKDKAPEKSGETQLLSGVHIVFTGKMTGSREQMKQDAKAKGGNVQSSVNRKTQILCCGSNVGMKKVDSAKENGVEIISESEYWSRYS